VTPVAGKQPLRIVADERMNGLEELIGPLGELVTAPGREINRALVADADVLLVRSITPVSAALLKDSSVRFVGTATSGLDHVDQLFLDEQGIALADARGSNGNAVVDYVLAALAALIVEGDLDVAELSVGIVGYGQVGSRLQARLSALGITTRVCDPPLALQHQAGNDALVDSLAALEEVLACKVVSLHVPFVTNGDYPTAPLMNQSRLLSMGADRVLINTSRGGVVDEAAWLALNEQGKAPLLVSDVWQDEPNADARMVSSARLATPHIAGYSERAKRQATAMLADALQQFTRGELKGRASVATANSLRQATDARYFEDTACWRALAEALPLAPLSDSYQQAMAKARAGARIEASKEESKEASTESTGLTAAEFDGFRTMLLNRREFCELSLTDYLPAPGNTGQVEFFRAAGFADSSESA